MDDTNKRSFFYFKIDLPNLHKRELEIEQIKKINIDCNITIGIVLNFLGATSTLYQFQSNTPSNSALVYIFSTSKRLFY